jgi:hypothetical protein
MASEKKELTLAERVASKIKSREAKPVITDGKAARLDTRRYNTHDYTAEGQLSKRFVHNTDEAIAEKMAEGYEFPEFWDQSLPRITTGGMTLMMRPKSIALRAQKFHLDHANALDSVKAPHEHAQGIPGEQRAGAQFYGQMEGTQQQTVPADAKARTFGPE